MYKAVANYGRGEMKAVFVVAANSMYSVKLVANVACPVPVMSMHNAPTSFGTVIG